MSRGRVAYRSVSIHTVGARRHLERRSWVRDSGGCTRIRRQWIKQGGGKITDSEVPGLPRKQELFRQLRREILAARLKVTLDQQLHRPTDPAVKSLARMRLPTSVRVRNGKVIGTMPAESRTGRHTHVSPIMESSESGRRGPKSATTRTYEGAR